MLPDIQGLIEQGIGYEKLGNNKEATSCFKKVLSHYPDNVTALAGFARGLARRGKIPSAAKLIARGLSSCPKDPDLLHGAGVVEMHAGSPDAAIACFQEALRSDPNHHGSLAEMAGLLFKQHHWADAILFLERLLAISPDDPSTLFALGTALLHLNKPAQAKAYLEQCLEIVPKSIGARINYSVSLRMMKCYQESEHIIRSVLTEEPNNIDALNACSSLYTDWRQFDKALSYSLKALEIDQNNIETLNSCAYLHIKRGQRQKGKQYYVRVLKLDPMNRNARFGYGGLLLQEENFKEGLPLYESRFDVMQSWLDGPWPVWDGQKPAGKTILVRSEQGMGDAIQFCRFLPMLKQAGARVFFSCPPVLGRLLRGVKGIDELYAADSLPIAEIEADVQIALLSLMGVFEVRAETIPTSCPYIHIDQELILEKKPLVTDCTKRLKVGLIWAGNPEQIDDHNRSLHLRQLLPLAELQDDVQFFSLQIGYAQTQIEEIGAELNIIDLAPYISDFADTAAFMQHMDMIVSVCTSTIHLAGAIACPAVALLPHAADWRWFLKRNDSPWYPTVHLIRQSKPGNWREVILSLKSYLATAKSRLSS